MKPRRPSAFRLFLYTPLRHPVNPLLLYGLPLTPILPRPFQSSLNHPWLPYPPIRLLLPKSSSRLCSSTAKLTSAYRPDPPASFGQKRAPSAMCSVSPCLCAQALAQVLLTDNVVASNAMPPPADECHGEEHHIREHHIPESYLYKKGCLPVGARQDKTNVR
ncbi:hypothetical protein C8J57DRAFT_1533059 [Mycena rebaudengoi]|nr:hypothetical protein C8J57DRAFT_1533059 [Mycena rebaudengoi]